MGVSAHPQTRGSEGAAGERQHAALAVGAGDERPADGELRVAQGGQQRAGAAETQADTEPPSIGEGGQRLVILERGGRTEGRHSRVSSSS